MCQEKTYIIEYICYFIIERSNDIFCLTLRNAFLLLKEVMIYSHFPNLARDKSVVLKGDIYS